MKFEYKKYQKSILRPVIPVHLVHNNITIGHQVLVDSGSDICILHAEIGRLLGIDIEAGERKEFIGVTGLSKPIYMHDITLNVGGWPFKVNFGFTSGMTAGSIYGIVGQQGFFDIFVVKFDLLKKQVELTSRKK